MVNDFIKNIYKQLIKFLCASSCLELETKIPVWIIWVPTYTSNFILRSFVNVTIKQYRIIIISNFVWFISNIQSKQFFCLLTILFTFVEDKTLRIYSLFSKRRNELTFSKTLFFKKKLWRICFFALIVI